MRQQTNQLLKNIDKDRLRTYLNITEKELSQFGYQDIGYIEFTDGDVLAIKYGSKKKVAKKLNEVEWYIEGDK